MGNSGGRNSFHGSRMGQIFVMYAFDYFLFLVLFRGKLFTLDPLIDVHVKEVVLKAFILSSRFSVYSI